MSFEQATIITRNKYEVRASIRYMRATRKSKNAQNKDAKKPKSLPSFLMTLPTSVMLSKCDYFMLLIGTGDDNNKLRVKGYVGAKPDIVGVAKASEFKHHIMLRFGYIEQLGSDIFDTTHCEVTRINDDEYEITAPVPLTSV